MGVQRRGVIRLLVLGLLGLPLGDIAFAEPVKSESAWSSFRNGPTLRGVATSELPEKLELLWTIETVDGVPSTAAIVDGRVYVGILDGALLCVDLRSGKKIWTYYSVEEVPKNSFRPGFKSSPLVTTDKIYLGDEEGIFHAIDRETGKGLWTFETLGEIISSATYVDGKILFGSYDNNLYCLDAETGKKLWAFETEGYVNCTPAVAGDYTFVTGCDEQLRIIEIATGKQKEVLPLGTYMIASPAVVDDKLYVGTYASEVICINWKTLAKEWAFKDSSREFPYHSSAAVNDNLVVVGGRDKMIHCLNRTNGEEVWSVATRGRIDSSPAIVDERVFVGSSDGNLYGLELGGGKILFKHKIGREVTASPAIGDGCLVIGSSSTGGELMCFGKPQ